MTAVTGLPVRLQVGAQLFGVHRVGSRVDVHEVEARADLRDRLGGRKEGERDSHHGIARPHARRGQGKPYRVRAARHAHAKAALAELGKVALEIAHHRPADEARGVEGSLKDRAKLLA
jgi:hypothetical protein